METLHIKESRRTSPLTVCGLNWAINLIGYVSREQLPEYTSRPDVAICAKCKGA